MEVELTNLPMRSLSLSTPVTPPKVKIFQVGIAITLHDDRLHVGEDIIVFNLVHTGTSNSVSKMNKSWN